VKRIVWTDPAKADVRSLSKPTAMHILSALHRFAESGAGNVKALQGKEELRLRIGATTGSSLSAPIPTPSKFVASITAAKPIAERPHQHRMCAGQDTGQKPDAHWMPRLSRRWFLLRRGQAQWRGAFANPASPARAPYTLQRKNGRFPPLLCFQDVNAHSPRGCRTLTRSRGFFSLAACFLQVYARKRGNRPFFALLPPSSLIPCTLTGSCSAAPVWGRRATPPPDAAGGAKNLTPKTTFRYGKNLTPYRGRSATPPAQDRHRIPPRNREDIQLLLNGPGSGRGYCRVRWKNPRPFCQSIAKSSTCRRGSGATITKSSSPVVSSRCRDLAWRAVRRSFGFEHT
jgi:hypothetical protein